jgi:excisionase family DNA binding protein
MPRRSETAERGQPTGVDADSRRLLSTAEVCAWLGMSRAWVLTHARGDRRPLIPCVRMGRKVKFRAADVERFIEENVHNSKSERTGR